jgi:hypothetical protein
MELDKFARATAMVIEPAGLAHVIILALEHERFGSVCTAAKTLKIRIFHLVDERDDRLNCQKIRRMRAFTRKSVI